MRKGERHTSKIETRLLPRRRLRHRPPNRQADVAEADDARDAHLQLGRPLHLHAPEHEERHDEQTGVGNDVPDVEADGEVDDVQADGFDVAAADFADVGVDGRVALEGGDEDGDEGADGQDDDEAAVDPQPAAGGEGGETHVEEEDGDFDGGDGDVEEAEGGGGDLFFGVGVRDLRSRFCWLSRGGGGGNRAHRLMVC